MMDTGLYGAQLDALRNLKDGWDSYGAKAIDKETIRVAQRMLLSLERSFHVVPLPDGGILLERHYHGTDIEIEIHGTSVKGNFHIAPETDDM